LVRDEGLRPSPGSGLHHLRRLARVEFFSSKTAAAAGVPRDPSALQQLHQVCAALAPAALSVYRRECSPVGGAACETSAGSKIVRPLIPKIRTVQSRARGTGARCAKWHPALLAR